MEQDDEEFEKLLGEIPRATSAPPHLEELQKPMESETQDASFLFAKNDVLRPVSDINSPALPFYNGLSLGLIDYQSIDSQPQQQALHGEDDDDQSLSSAFCKLNFEDASSNGQTCSENGTLVNGLAGSFSNGGCSQNGIAMVSKELFESCSFSPDDPFRQNLSLAEEALSNDFSNGIDDVAPVPARDLCTNGFYPSLDFQDKAFLVGVNQANYRQPQNFEALSNDFSNGIDDVAPVLARDLCTNGFYPSLDFQHKAFLDGVHQANYRQPQNFEGYGPGVASFVNGVPAYHPFTPVGLRIPSSMYGNISSFCEPQRHIYAQREEERVQNRQLMRQQLFMRQQQLQEQQARFYASLQAHPSLLGSSHTRLPSVSQSDQHVSWNPTLPMNNFQPKHLQKQNIVESVSLDAERKYQNMMPVFGPQDAVALSQCANSCRFFAQGFCSRGDACPFLHVPTPISEPTGDTTKGGTSAEIFHHGKIFSKKSFRGGQSISSATAVPSIAKRKGNMGNGNISFDENHLHSSNQSDALHEDGKVIPIGHEYLNVEQSRPGILHHHGLQQQAKYNTLKEVEGCIYSIAKDQHGCRFLQRKFEEGITEDVQKIFVEIIEHIVELMTDPFGNYLVQKLLEVCNESQQMEILDRVSEKGQLVTVCLNMHGTRAVQKLIETLKLSEQVAIVIASLKQGVVTLIKDLNGNHVIQRCLQRLCNDDNQFIFDAAASHCVEIATHRHGCCVLQRCIDYASGVQRQHLVAEIASNALVLSQDPFGNYVVQYILDLAMPWATMDVVTQLKGNFACLSMQKFSSNVVEKCLKLAGEENRADIIKELMNSSCLSQLLQDPYANYVVQCALTISKGALHLSLVDAIKPHLPSLRSSPYGRRILSRTNLKRQYYAT